MEGLPDRPVSLAELKARLLHPSASYQTRDQALSVLLRLVAEEGDRWLVGLAGVLLPGLRTATWALFECCPQKAADIEAEVLAGLIAAVRRTPPGGRRLAARLTWAARHQGERALRAELAERGRPTRRPVPEAPPRPFGHPDFVLAEAVRTGIIEHAEDAALVGTTRLEHVSLRQAAKALGITLRAARDRRLLAERALVKGIREGFPANRPPNPDSSRGGRPRQGRVQAHQLKSRRPAPKDPRR